VRPYLERLLRVLVHEWGPHNREFFDPSR
jgi:hypothetical protein